MLSSPATSVDRRNARLKTRQLTPTLGVEITGADLSVPLDDTVFAAIKEVWLRHKVAVFPGQNLTEDALMRFGRRFGELEIHVRSTYHSRDNPEVMIVSNKKEDGRAIGVLGDGEAQWHIDQSYMPQPTFGTILFGQEIPPEGGDTWFADLATAYDRLPQSLKAKMQGKRVVNSVDRHNRRDAATRPDLAMSAEQLKRAPDSPHPLVRTHPLLGTRAIYYSPSHTAEVEGLPEPNSQALLAELLPYMTEPDLIYKHRWSPGDVVMWDNSATMHRRDPFPGEFSRLMKRVSFRYPPGHRVPV
jgi:taurine dioxygenase